MASVSLQQAADEWVTWRKISQGIKPATCRGDRMYIMRFIKVTGNLLCHNVTTRHIENALNEASNLTAGSRNNYVQKLRKFFQFCSMRKFTRDDPMMGVRLLPQPQRVWRHVPATQFGQLLDSAANPRDRIALACVLYLFIRQSELRSIQVCDVNLVRGEILINVHKSGGVQDLMPIPTELDAELRRWLTFYSQTMAVPLDPEWLLIPSRRYVQRDRRADGTFMEGRCLVELRPTQQMAKPEKTAQCALEAIGFHTRQPDGKAMGEGMHTLRRSGARALFDRLLEDSYDGALRLVMSMLHHKQSQTTEIYLGLTLDKKRRDDLLRGETMYPMQQSNVIELVKGQ